MPRLRRLSVTCVLVCLAGRTGALEGAPPFEWFVTGRVAAEGNAAVSVTADVGAGDAFVGGTAIRQLAVRRWVVAPLAVRYGLFPGLEALAVFPFEAGTSDQEYVNVVPGGMDEVRHATLAGADFSDPELAVRWQAWTSGDERAAIDLLGGLVVPLGTNVWSYNQDNFITGPDVPDLAFSDGAWKVAIGVDARAEVGSGEVVGFLGWLAKFPVEAVAIEPGLSTIEVHPPSPLVGRIRPSWRVAEGWRLAAQVDGYWAPAGTIVPGGLLAAFPGSLPRMLDSYANLVAPSAACWAGVGIGVDLSESAALSLDVQAPVAERRVYRAFRAGAGVTYGWKP